MFKYFLSLTILFPCLLSFSVQAFDFSFQAPKKELDLFAYAKTQEDVADPQSTLISVSIPPVTGECVRLDLQLFFDGTPTTTDCGSTSNRCSNASVRSGGQNRVGFRGCIDASTSGRTLVITSEALYSMIQDLSVNSCNSRDDGVNRCCGLPVNSPTPAHDKAVSCVRLHNNTANTGLSDDTVILVSCSGSSCSLDGDSAASFPLSVYDTGCSTYTQCN